MRRSPSIARARHDRFEPSGDPCLPGAYASLPGPVRDLADRNFALLKSDPRHPSLHFKPVGRLWSARVRLSPRALTALDGDDCIWFQTGSRADYNPPTAARTARHRPSPACGRRCRQADEGFAAPHLTARYGCKRLVWYESYPDISDAIARERAFRKWPRAAKIALIEAMNPDWQELYRGLG